MKISIDDMGDIFYIHITDYSDMNKRLLFQHKLLFVSESDHVYVNNDGVIVMINMKSRISPGDVIKAMKSLFGD